MARRRRAIEELLEEAGLDHLVFCGANRFGSAVQWLTGWPVTTEAVGVFTPGKPDAMFVQHVNHAPLAQQIAIAGRGRLGRRLVDRRRHRGVGAPRRARRQGRRHRPDDLRAARDAHGAIRRYRQSQSPLYAAAPGQVGGRNRLDADRRRLDGSRHDGLRDGLRPGLSERELGDLVDAILHRARRHQRHPFFRRHRDGAAELAVPTQFAGNRKSRAAISCSPRSAPRSGSIPARCCAASPSDEDPPALYRELHAVADAAFDAVAAVLKDGAMPRR